MPCPPKEDVQEALGPFHPKIRGVIDKAWAEWRAVAAFRTDQGFVPLMYPRTIANYVFDAMARSAIADFASNSSVRIEYEPQTIKLFFKDRVLARFKKGDDQNLGQNNPTQASLAFEHADGVLPGMPHRTAKVEFVYRANEINTRLEHVLVVARDGDQLLWDYEIAEVSKTDDGVVELPPRSPVEPEGEELVTPKTVPAEKSDDES